MTHDFRKTRATDLYYKNKAKLTEVKAFLGHKSVVTTQHYIEENTEFAAGLAAAQNANEEEPKKKAKKSKHTRPLPT